MYLNRRFDVIPPHLRILALLAAHTCAGNLTRVAIDWSYLPEVFFFLLLLLSSFAFFSRSYSYLLGISCRGLRDCTTDGNIWRLPKGYQRARDHSHHWGIPRGHQRRKGDQT